jgi:Stage II sporulation protein E (SpoIIE)
VSSEPGTKGDRAGYCLRPRLRAPDATADPARAASQILDALVPGFADAAGIYALEELLADRVPARHVTGTAGDGLVARRLAAATTGQHALREAFPSGEAIALAADSPSVRCLRHGCPVIYARPGGRALQRISPQARATLSRYTSFLAAPMIIRGTAVGMLILARQTGAPPFLDADTHATADLAGRAAGAIADSLALMRHKSVAEALQPSRPAVTRMAHGPLEIAGRCRPATGSDVGGDWYDIIPLPGGRTGLIVGEVTGHGPLAVTAMTQLSAAAYALADSGLPSAEVVRQLNQTTLALPRDTLANCTYAVIDPASQSCAITAAGHLFPVLAMPDGTTRVLDMPAGPSLGVAPANYGEARIRLRPGTILALYTDGLVETRARSFERGILALRTVLARPHEDLDSACEELTASSGGNHEDDATVVLVRIPFAPTR